MKGRSIIATLVLCALVAAGCGSSSIVIELVVEFEPTSSSSSTAASTGSGSSSCTASIGFEGPITGPVAQLGGEQLHFAQLAISQDNAANHTNISLVQGDTQLQPAQATTVTQQFVSNSKILGVVGPAGSQEVEAVGPLFGRAGIPFITGSATNSSLTAGKNPTFFRVVSRDDVQGPQDAHYIISHLHPKAIMIVDDQEAYSTGLVAAMTPVFKAAGHRRRPRVGQPEAHRLLLAGGQGQRQHLGDRAAVAGGRQRAAVRQEPGRAEEERGHLRHRRSVLTRSVRDRGQLCVLVRTRHHRDPVRRLDRRGGQGQVRAASARSGLRCTRPRTCSTRPSPRRASRAARAGRACSPRSRRPTSRRSILGQPIKFTSSGDLQGGKFFLFKIAKGGKYQLIPSS